MKFLILSFLFFIFSVPSFGFVVLIDPGHGGKELGAVSTIYLKDRNGKKIKKKVYEKDLTLTLAKKIKQKLEKHFSTYLTRSFDRTVSLEKRAELADTVKADLFISIHFNSSSSHKFHGFETYYLDNHDDKAIKKVEAIENIGMEGENKIINHILIDLVIKQTVGRSDRGVKPGLFYVLALSKRPGVLVEAGFMSNPKEIFKIRSKAYLDAYAESIAQGVVKYYGTLPPKEIPLF